MHLIFISPVMLAVSSVSPSVVLLDNHTTSRTMAGSGINIIVQKTIIMPTVSLTTPISICVKLRSTSYMADMFILANLKNQVETVTIEHQLCSPITNLIYLALIRPIFTRLMTIIIM